MRIEITKNVDDYTRQTWEFIMFDLNAVFVGYVIEEKRSRHRKWRVTKKWNKYNKRFENSLEEPQLHEDIKHEALEKACDSIRVSTWNEWKQ